MSRTPAKGGVIRLQQTTEGEEVAEEEEEVGSYTWLQYLNAIAQGLDIEPEMNVLEHCLDTYSIVHNKMVNSATVLGHSIAEGGSTMVQDADGADFEVTWVQAWINFTKVLYDASHWFKDCYSRQEHNAYVFWLFINHYQTISNYMVNLVPNVLAYAIFYTQWAARIQELEDQEPVPELELWYVYAVITRKLLLFDYVPDKHNEDLQPLDFFDEDDEDDASDDILVNNQLFSQVRDKHLRQSLLDSQDTEPVIFYAQYLSYSQWLGQAFWLTLQESAKSSQQIYDYFTDVQIDQEEMDQIAETSGPMGKLLLAALRMASQLNNKSNSHFKLRQSSNE